MQDVTLCTVVHHAPEAAALMWESYCKHHDRTPLFVCDNGGGEEYFKEKADLFISPGKNIGHGRGLDALCLSVETPYTLICDTDIEFLLPTVSEMKSKDAFAVCNLRTYYEGMHKEDLWKIEAGFDPHCALFKTKPLQALLKHFSFTEYRLLNETVYYDVGCMLYRAALAANLGIHNASLWLPKHVHHFGHVSCGPYDHKFKEHAERQTEVIRKRLTYVRHDAMLP
jgi:hypothetical protein